MAGALGQSGNGAPGGLWNTNSQGVASPQAGRPAMTGGLQPLAMLQAYRAGLPMNQLQAINPYTPRPTQFLPQALPNFDYAAQFRAQQDAMNAAKAAPPQLSPIAVSGGPGGGDGSVGSVSSDGGQDGSSAAAGGSAGAGAK